VKSILEPAGVPTITIDSGTAALALLERGVPGLILLDVVMPELDGFAVLRRLRAIRLHTTTPVIMLTALRDRELVLETLRAGAVDYILKPFEHDKLLRKVRRVMSMRTQGKPAVELPPAPEGGPDRTTRESTAPVQQGP
jgi:DNA-binding response OmpR family regulator